MKVIVIFSGGGVMGMISLSAWQEVEKKLKKRLFEVADLVVGTSIGAITSGILSSGKLSASELVGMYSETMKPTFKKKFGRFYPKYLRKYIDYALDKFVGVDFIMSECKTRSIITSVRAEDKANHYFKSWEQKDGQMPLKEAITRSYAAPLYFGKWVRPDGTWLDGGTGSMNTPIVAGIWEALRQGWLGKEKVHILSIGTGFTPEITSHDKMQKIRWLKELSLFIDPADGGLARYQSQTDHIRAGQNLLGKVDGYSFQHVDIQLPRSMNKIDGIENIRKYYEMGKKVAEGIDFAPLEEKCT